MDRLEDIRTELTEAERIGNPEVTFYGYVTYSDVRFLLERIEHLQRENERLRRGLERIVHPTAGTWIDPATVAGDALTSPTTNLSNRLDD